MSRRRSSDVDHDYGAVMLVCPEGHTLGRALKQQGEYLLEHPLQRVDAPNGETKVKARCRKCEAAGRHRDLQASWEGRLLGMLDALNEEPNAGVSRLVIGGD